MKTKLTLKSVRDELSALGVTIARGYGNEWKVRIKGSPNGHGYFTSDLDDALATGKLMAEKGADYYKSLPLKRFNLNA
jgi:hypothetical protein